MSITHDFVKNKRVYFARMLFSLFIYIYTYKKKYIGQSTISYVLKTSNNSR